MLYACLVCCFPTNRLNAVQGSGHRKSGMRAPKGALARAPPHLTHENEKARGNWQRQLMRDASLKQDIAGRSPDVSCTATMARNCLLGHPRMTNKEQIMPTTNEWQLVCAACTVTEKRKQLMDNSEAARYTTPVVHLLTCRTIFCRDLDSAGDTSRLRLRPANLR